MIYFIRHAESNDNNHDNFSREFTDKGKADCSLVTEYLSDKKIVRFEFNNKKCILTEVIDILNDEKKNLMVLKQ